MFLYRSLHDMHLCSLQSAVCTCKALSLTVERYRDCFTDVLAFLTVPTLPTQVLTYFISRWMRSFFHPKLWKVSTWEICHCHPVSCLPLPPFHPIPSYHLVPSQPPSTLINDYDYDETRRRRRHRLFVFFGPRCQLTAILDDGRPLCLPDAALRPPAAKHSHNSRLAASSSSNHCLYFPRWKDTFSSFPTTRFSRCGNMQIPRIRGLTPYPVIVAPCKHVKRISTTAAALDLRICIHSSFSLSLKVSSPEMGRRATEPTRPDRRCRPRS
ncbi:hypothetical protein BDP55DRAFT_160444 [Colletotrichum godetiae]|uniref:Uncharacterized protein n=1 Tax=Colletotrichum godetiae TaxID=1209918 RepID=A0AAJ0ESM3_9PEZI|nr:uncharacterized protein BDP55DRAFT_160444 [Colletotrichum godetiae]KAK1675231.1 hypothetical protein BDP55DRAFT_160444 [Colletotrichum godetiae]